MHINVYLPTKIIFGINCINEIGELTYKYGNKGLLVIGNNSARYFGILNKVISNLQNSNGKIEIDIVSGIQPNCNLSQLSCIIKKRKQYKPDWILGLGGGSVIDASKVIAFGLVNEGSVWSYFPYVNSRQKILKECIPIIAVPTCIGSGSEVSCGAVVTNEETNEKVPIFNELLFPKATFIDPLLSVSVSKFQTAASGCDALCHVLEQYLTSSEFPSAQTRYAETTIVSILSNLPKIIENGQDVISREQLAWDSMIALFPGLVRGLGVSPLHRIEHIISGTYSNSHGAGLAALLPSFIGYCSKIIPERTEKLLGVISKTVLSGESLEEKFQNWLLEVGLLPTSIKILHNDIKYLAEKCINLYGDRGILLEMLQLDERSINKLLESAFAKEV